MTSTTCCNWTSGPDRILPNGWCLLQPRQSGDRGNACLTCDKFATDASFLPELRQQKDKTLHLIGQRQEAFRARASTPMSPDNIWLQGRRREASALDAIITTLQHHPEAGGTPEQPGAGTAHPRRSRRSAAPASPPAPASAPPAPAAPATAGHGNDRHKAREPGQLAEGRRRPHRRHGRPRRGGT